MRSIRPPRITVATHTTWGKLTMDKWKFYQQPDGHWRWWHDDPHEGRSRSQSAFVSRNDCIVNAMLHGYLAVSSAMHGAVSATPPELRSAMMLQSVRAT